MVCSEWASLCLERKMARALGGIGFKILKCCTWSLSLHRVFRARLTVCWVTMGCRVTSAASIAPVLSHNLLCIIGCMRCSPYAQTFNELQVRKGRCGYPKASGMHAPWFGASQFSRVGPGVLGGGSEGWPWGIAQARVRGGAWSHSPSCTVCFKNSDSNQGSDCVSGVISK